MSRGPRCAKIFRRSVSVGLENEALHARGHLTNESPKSFDGNPCFFFRVISPLILHGQMTCVRPDTGLGGHRFMHYQPVSFPQWKVELARASLSPDQREAFRKEILNYLHHCKIKRSPASADSMKQY